MREFHFPWEAGEDGQPVTRIAHVPLSEWTLERMLVEGLRGPLRIDGLPADATLLGLHHEWMPRCFLLRFHSATFAPVPENVDPPTLMLTVTSPEPEPVTEGEVRESVEREIAGWWGE